MQYSATKSNVLKTRRFFISTWSSFHIFKNDYTSIRKKNKSLSYFLLEWLLFLFLIFWSLQKTFATCKLKNVHYQYYNKFIRSNFHETWNLWIFFSYFSSMKKKIDQRNKSQIFVVWPSSLEFPIKRLFIKNVYSIYLLR